VDLRYDNNLEVNWFKFTSVVTINRAGCRLLADAVEKGVEIVAEQ